MKLLLDEQIPRNLMRSFPSNFVVSNVQAEGWAGAQNGELLKLAHSRGFNALISADKNISYQQNKLILPISVLVFYVSRLRSEELEPLIPEAVLQLEKLSSPAFIRIGV